MNDEVAAALLDAIRDLTEAIEGGGGGSAPASSGSVGGGAPGLPMNGSRGGAAAGRGRTSAGSALQDYASSSASSAVAGATGSSAVAGATGSSLAGGLAGAGVGLGVGLGVAAVGKVWDSTVGFAANATLKAGRRAAREFAIRGATRSAEFGSSVSGRGLFASSFSDAVSTLPILGGLAGQAGDARRSAEGRVIGFFANSVRYGGQVSDKQINSMFDIFQGQEQRAIEFQRRVKGISIQRAGDQGEDAKVLVKLTKGVSNLDTTLGRLMAWLARTQ